MASSWKCPACGLDTLYLVKPEKRRLRRVVFICGSCHHRYVLTQLEMFPIVLPLESEEIKNAVSNDSRSE